MKINKFIWLIPFILFVVGYFVAHLFLGLDKVVVPGVIGRSLLDGTMHLSKSGLSARIINEKEDLELEEGLILDQFPRANCEIKPSYPVRLVVSKKPEPKIAPDFTRKHIDDIVRDAKAKNITIKRINVPSDKASSYCISQFPGPGELVTDVLKIYISVGEKTYHIVPDFIGEDAAELQASLLKSGIKVVLFHKHDVEPDHFCKKCKVLEQTPMAGAIEDLKSGLTIQLLVG